MHLEPYKHQVAGHCCIVKLGGRVCKPLVPRECEFYHKIRKEYPQLIPFVPEFFGNISVKKKANNLMEGDSTDYIVLQDLTAGMRKPCIMDMKMGTRQRFPTSTSLGFRHCGMRVWRGEKLHVVDRLFGRGLNASSVGPAIEDFLFDGCAMHIELIPSILSTLQRMLEVMEECPVRLYTSSLLFLYEGDDNSGDDESQPRRVDIRIVDFAHGFSKDTKEGENDDGFVLGLKNLIILFEHISQKYALQSDNNSPPSSPSSSPIPFIEKPPSPTPIPKLTFSPSLPPSNSFVEKNNTNTVTRCAPFLSASGSLPVVAQMM